MRMVNEVAGGVAHDLPADLSKALTSDPEALANWESLTPLARNEWICWVISVKKPETRREHVERVCRELKEGMRRPCCWMGCTHRRDKPLSRSQQFLLKTRQDRRGLPSGGNTNARSGRRPGSANTAPPS